jgi:cytochrome c553
VLKWHLLWLTLFRTIVWNRGVLCLLISCQMAAPRSLSAAGGSSGPENRMRVCPQCHRFHTKEWFKPHDDSTPLSE